MSQQRSFIESMPGREDLRVVPAAVDGRRLRILFLNHNVVRAGGTYYRAFDCAKHLVRRGHSVTLMAISQDSRWRKTTEHCEGVEIIHTPDWFWGIGRTGWDPWDTIVRTRIAAREDWDLIHAWDSRPAVILPALIARAVARKKTKLIVDWSDWWGRGGTQSERGGGWTRYLYNAIETFFEEAFRRSADGATVISTALRDRAIRLGVPPETIRILLQGCDEVKLPAMDRDAARKELNDLGYSTGERLFITIGVLNTSDAALLFDVIRAVRRQMPAARFAILGRIRSRVPADLLENGVEQVGYVPNDVLSLYMAAADALIVPLADTISNRGRWPSRVNLALSRGVPVVVSRVGDLPHLLDREGAAFVANPDVDDLARAIVHDATDSKAAAAVIAAGSRVAAELLPWPDVIAGLEKFYYEVLDSAGSALAP